MEILTKFKINFAIVILVQFKNMTDIKALEDYKKIIAGIIDQSMDEYVKLQHPKFRKKTYLYESFASSFDIFFDPDYTFLYFIKADGTNMTTQDMLSVILTTATPELTVIQDHLIAKAAEYWDKKYMKTITLPDCFIFKGHTYALEHTKEQPSIDHVAKIIRMDRKQSLKNEKQFLKFAFEIASIYSSELSPPEVMYEILKMNQIQFNY